MIIFWLRLLNFNKKYEVDKQLKSLVRPSSDEGSQSPKEHIRLSSTKPTSL